jgi:hypothetical protein
MSTPIYSLPWACGRGVALTARGGCRSANISGLAACSRWHGARRRAFKWNVEPGVVESSAQSALVLNILRLGDGGTSTWAAVPIQHLGGHARPPGSQQMAATSISKSTSVRLSGQPEAENEQSSADRARVTICFGYSQIVLYGAIDLRDEDVCGI